MIYKISALVAVAHQLDAPSVQRNGEILPQNAGQRIASFPSKRCHEVFGAAGQLDRCQEGNEGGVVEVEKAARSGLSGFKARGEEPPEFS
jgi:hypothetical protein